MIFILLGMIQDFNVLNFLFVGFAQFDTALNPSS